ncbi:uncharacterized protein M421DRAFT_8806 [Didymella exigua CBS 183.55]|uniref:Heme haloperoxidase family profile domain-containing protein n=1 Tax=Didymella exigua CBS 183.55 TaxID=1150837 RepID=A0A6A5RBP8_9PLEO|nr:uncharacterized protein M421DRAFT_8806 [Didymella exigua CBS 183.55]KAF1924504.1 hypothetical protein M421DRAFT_8806 [Didymella exigua CBS 183.55]
MKISFLIAAFLLALTSARVAQPLLSHSNVSTAGDITTTSGTITPLPYPPTSKNVWNTCKCRGENFWKAMHTVKEGAGKLFNPPRDTSESTFTDTAELTKWSWNDAEPQATYFDFAKAWGVDHVLRAIGVSDKATKDGGSIQVFKATHGDSNANGGGHGISPYNVQPRYTANGRTYRVTGSEYNFGFDPSGVLLALDRKSPQFAGSKRNPRVQGDGLPELQSFSDVAWLKWKGATGRTPTSMRYFASLSITNDETRGIINIVLSRANFDQLPAWPGHDVDPNTEEGAALLGSPNALAFSYFLVQHKATLGDLKISKITIFKNSLKFADPCLLLAVKKAELVPPRPAPKPPKEPHLPLFNNANDDAWYKAKCKGASFVRAMRGSDRDAGQVFKPTRDPAAPEFEDLDFDTAEKWGWGYSEKIASGDFRDWGIDHVLRELGLSDKCNGRGGNMDYLNFVHGFEQLEDGSWDLDPTPYDVDGGMYRRLCAHYGIAFDA